MAGRLRWDADDVVHFARARHRCFDHTWIDGLLVPIRRRVTPRGLPGPTLVSIEIDELRHA